MLKSDNCGQGSTGVTPTRFRINWREQRVVKCIAILAFVMPLMHIVMCAIFSGQYINSDPSIRITCDHNYFRGIVTLLLLIHVILCLRYFPQRKVTLLLILIGVVIVYAIWLMRTRQEMIFMRDEGVPIPSGLHTILWGASSWYLGALFFITLLICWYVTALIAGQRLHRESGVGGQTLNRAD